MADFGDDEDQQRQNLRIAIDPASEYAEDISEIEKKG